MRSKALIFSGSAWVISARRWSAAITTPSMTRWSKPRRSNCFHAVLLQSTASCSRTRAKWQRVVEQSVNSKSSSIANAVAQVYIPELTQYVDDPSSLEWAVVRPNITFAEKCRSRHQSVLQPNVYSFELFQNL